MGSHRGVVVFDMDGTLLDDMPQIGQTAAQVLHEVFGTALPEAERQYFRTTGKPFELQLREIYPEATPFELVDAARRFHDAKVKDAYAHAAHFPEVPRMLKRLDQAGWALAIATGAEREMAEVILEREGLRFFFEDVLGAAQGTKEVHLRAYQKRWPRLPLVLVGDSRYDLESARKVPGVVAIGRACLFRSWAISPADMRRWGAAWSDYSLESLPEVLNELFPPGGRAGGGETVKLFTARVPGPSLRVFKGGATSYRGDRKCDVSSCEEQATWRWKKAYLCDRHITEEARSAVHRQTLAEEGRRASAAVKVRRRKRARRTGDFEPHRPS